MMGVVLSDSCSHGQSHAVNINSVSLALSIPSFALPAIWSREGWVCRVRLRLTVMFTVSCSVFCSVFSSFSFFSRLLRSY